MSDKPTELDLLFQQAPPPDLGEELPDGEHRLSRPEDLDKLLAAIASVG